MRLKRITERELETQAFAKLYKWLFEPPFEHLTSDSAMVYTLLRDRYELSVKNGWVNDNGEVYLVYTRKDLCKILKKSDSTIGRSLRQLREAKLIESEPQGLNKPNRIYIMDITIENKGPVIMTAPDQSLLPTSKTDSIKTEGHYVTCGNGLLFFSLYEKHFGIRHRKFYGDASILDKYGEELHDMILDFFYDYQTEDRCTLDYFIKVMDRYK